MRLVVTDGVAWPICLSVTIESPANADKPIEIPFGLWNQVGRENHVLDGSPDPHGNGQF